jgi:hypothetical protein
MRWSGRFWRSIFICGSLLGLLASGTQAAKGDPEVVGLRVERHAGVQRVSYRVENALSDEILEKLESGIVISFRHRIELYAKRAVPLWFGKSLAWTVVEVTATYDGLTRQYHLSRAYKLRRRGKEPEGVAMIADELFDTDSLNVVRVWMSEIDGVPLLPVESVIPLERRRVEVTTSMGRKFFWMMFPVTITASAETSLED